MRYLMLVCRDPAIELTPEERAAMREGVVAWVDEMEGRGILLHGGHELRPASYGRTVRVRDPRRGAPPRSARAVGRPVYRGGHASPALSKGKP
jgi:hypothetical protein